MQLSSSMADVLFEREKQIQIIGMKALKESTFNVPCLTDGLVEPTLTYYPLAMHRLALDR